MNRIARAVVRDNSLAGRLAKKALVKVPGTKSKLTLRELVMLSAFPRPYYAYTAVRASELAVRLGYREVTWIEFGVAGGNGLIALEEIKSAVEQLLPISVNIVGFDMGSGLPSPVDYRDLPYHWRGGFYEMDVPRLKAKLKSSTLVLGPVAETLPEYFASASQDAPVGMISFDLDYYSSTVDAFKVFDLPNTALLPRVMCYMDDVVGTTECYSDYTGERLAIREFNENNSTRKISQCYDFEVFAYERWQEKIMIYHDFEHSRYNEYVGDSDSEGHIALAE